MLYYRTTAVKYIRENFFRWAGSELRQTEQKIARLLRIGDSRVQVSLGSSGVRMTESGDRIAAGRFQVTGDRFPQAVELV
jgi:hypothetical protein